MLACNANGTRQLTRRGRDGRGCLGRNTSALVPALGAPDVLALSLRHRTALKPPACRSSRITRQLSDRLARYGLLPAGAARQPLARALDRSPTSSRAHAGKAERRDAAQHGAPQARLGGAPCCAASRRSAFPACALELVGDRSSALARGWRAAPAGSSPYRARRSLSCRVMRDERQAGGFSAVRCRSESARTSGAPSAGTRALVLRPRQPRPSRPLRFNWRVPLALQASILARSAPSPERVDEQRADHQQHQDGGQGAHHTPPAQRSVADSREHPRPAAACPADGGRRRADLSTTLPVVVECTRWTG